MTRLVLEYTHDLSQIHMNRLNRFRDYIFSGYDIDIL